MIFSKIKILDFLKRFLKIFFQKNELSFFDHKKFSAVTFEKINIFLQIQKHMNRHDGGFHFRYCTAKTDHYTKSYPDFSLGGGFNY